MSTTLPFAALSVRRTRALVSQRATTADPEELHRSGTTPRAGTPPVGAHERSNDPSALHAA
jgi:hypothetical protein